MSLKLDLKKGRKVERTTSQSIYLAKELKTLIQEKR